MWVNEINVSASTWWNYIWFEIHLINCVATLKLFLHGELYVQLCNSTDFFAPYDIRVQGNRRGNQHIIENFKHLHKLNL